MVSKERKLAWLEDRIAFKEWWIPRCAQYGYLEENIAGLARWQAKWEEVYAS